MPGIYHSYSSDYPNQVQQLNFSISQNHYVLKSGEIKYQSKKLDVNWKNYEKTGKKHVVNFLVRDHYSGCFYAEIHLIDAVLSMRDFLFNSWREKQFFEFCGIPKNMIMGRHIIEKFPEVDTFSKKHGLNIELATSGFATGIRSVREWENNVKMYSMFDGCNTIEGFQKNTEKICREINLRNSGKTEPSLTKWADNKPYGKIINDNNEFNSLFE